MVNYQQSLNNSAWEHDGLAIKIISFLLEAEVVRSKQKGCLRGFTCYYITDTSDHWSAVYMLYTSCYWMLNWDGEGDLKGRNQDTLLIQCSVIRCMFSEQTGGKRVFNVSELKFLNVVWFTSRTNSIVESANPVNDPRFTTHSFKYHEGVTTRRTKTSSSFHILSCFICLLLAAKYKWQLQTTGPPTLSISPAHQPL